MNFSLLIEGGDRLGAGDLTARRVPPSPTRSTDNGPKDWRDPAMALPIAHQRQCAGFGRSPDVATGSMKTTMRMRVGARRTRAASTTLWLHKPLATSSRIS